MKTTTKNATHRAMKSESIARRRPTAIRSILVPIDFSASAERALEFAESLAKQFGAKLTLLNVVEPFPTPDFAYYPLVMENEKVQAKSKEELGRVLTRAGIDAGLVEK